MTLLADPARADIAQVRRLTREQVDRRRADDRIGCGDDLLGLCFLLYLGGEADDVLLIDEAKHTNFDCGCTIDRDFYRMRRGREEMRAVVRGRPRAAAIVEGAFDQPNHDSPEAFEAYLRGYFGVG